MHLPQVTRKIIRKCVSDEGVEHERVSLEGDPQGTISIAGADGYSKVVKRTVLKSEGDHSEVCTVYHDDVYCVLYTTFLQQLILNSACSILSTTITNYSSE